ncbi:DNA damage-regulated autophagy modulator protein 1 isoform X1 [Frankliniella occidentalis]|uniref:DNA damage-regulated autophagy modulator protein 1 isoform X1 n=2 Tax=Frankliniella occidentalis TaxID=133901 RepID=A0A9C6X655_FRAOC|nr:DNA damage-regulated autophagy modulator protein 1 isoform X1 [Frankliniella occidentalis]
MTAAVKGLTKFTMLLTVLAVVLLITISVCYAVSVALGHVPIVFPYISETGNWEPESCVFSFGMNIASFLYMVAVYLRYHELLVYRESTPNTSITPRLNRIAWALGTASAIGLCVVANFQVQKVRIVHYLGAFTCFVGGSVYFGIQAWFSKCMCPWVSSLNMVRLRTTLTVLSAIALTVCLACALAAISQFDGKDQVKWSPENKGYTLHIVSTVAEWLVALIFVGSIITYIPEMTRISVHPPKFRFEPVKVSPSRYGSIGSTPHA